MQRNLERTKKPPARRRRTNTTWSLAAIASAVTATSVMAASQTWNGLGGDGLWITGTNWSGGAAPGVINPAPAGVSQDVATFNGPVGAVSPIIFDSFRNVASLVFDTADAGAYTIQHPTWDPGNPNNGLSGDGLILTTSTATLGNITLNSTVVNAQVFNTPILFLPANSQNSVYSFVNNAADSNATLTFNGSLINRSANTRPLTLTLGGSNTGNNTIREIYGGDLPAGAPHGAIVLNKVGTGTWTLTSANPSWLQKTSNGVAAGVQVNEGTLVLKDGGGLGTLTQPNIRAQGTGTLRLDGIALANNGLTLSATGRLLGTGASSVGGVAVATTATDARLETADVADILIVNGPVSGGGPTGVLHVGGPGQLQVSNTGTFVGTWSFDSGTTILNSGDALGPGSRISFGAGSTARLQLNGSSAITAGLSTNATLGTPVVENGVGAATLTVNNSVAQTFGGVMQDGAASSSLALAKGGVGALVLTGGNTYSGGTIISNGTLLANNASGSATGSGGVAAIGTGMLGGIGTISGAVTMGSGSTIAPGEAAGSIGTLRVGAITLDAGSKLSYDVASSDSLDSIVVNNSGGLSINGGQLAINGAVTAFITNGVYNLIAYSGAIGGTGVSSLSMHPNSQNLATNTYTFGEGGGFVTLTIASSGGAITYWDADANGNWSTGPWTTPTPNAPGAFASFGGGGTAITAGRTITVDGAYTVGTLAFNNPSFGYTLAAGAGAHITLNNNASPSFITNAAGTHTVDAPLTMTNGATVTITNATDTLSLNGAIDGPGPLNKNGTGTLVLGGNNTYTGGTVLNAGTLVIQSAASLGDAGGSLTFGGGGIKLVGNVTDSRNWELKDLADVVIDTNGQTLDHSGSILPQPGATGGLVKNGAGTLVLQGGNGYFGPTTINGGTLTLNNNANLGDIATGAPLVLNGGATLVTTATIDLDNFTVNPRPVTINGDTTFDVADATTLTVRGVVDGTGTLTKTGNGTLVLTEANTYPGGATVKGGTLTAGNGLAFGAAGNLNMSNGTRLHFLGGGNTFLGYPMFVDPGATGATVTFSSANAANAYFGPITGAATDTISISGIGGAQVSFSGGANLQQFANFPGLVRIEADGSLRFSATAGLNNGGTNTTFEVLGSLQGRNNGTVNLGELKGTGSLTGSTAVDNNTTTFSVGAMGTNSTFEGIIVDANTTTGRRAALTKVGTGTLTLTGNNTYTGPTTVMSGTLVLGPAAQEPVLGGPTVITPAFADIRAGMLALQYADEASGAALSTRVSGILDAGYDQVPQFSLGELRSVGIAAGRVMGWRNDLAGSQVLVRPTIIGDLNLDGTVSISDFIDLASKFGATNATWADGDVNYDQNVTISDFIDLAANFGASFSGEVLPISAGEQKLLDGFYAANVPEPHALGWLAAATLTLCRRRSRRRP